MDIERIEDFIDGLAEVSERYSSYKEVNPSEIEYHVICLKRIIFCELLVAQQRFKKAEQHY